jgi:hypothetical protein
VESCASARPASSGPARSPRPCKRWRRAPDRIGTWSSSWSGQGSTGGQKCALPTGESLLLQSLVQGFQAEFASHIGRSCPLPRELPFHKLVDWDATAGRFTYDLAYAHKQPDWTYAS